MPQTECRSRKTLPEWRPAGTRPRPATPAAPKREAKTSYVPINGVLGQKARTKWTLELVQSSSGPLIPARIGHAAHPLLAHSTEEGDDSPIGFGNGRQVKGCQDQNDRRDAQNFH